jgi:dTDP-L-rhamnose 4-epimerase
MEYPLLMKVLLTGAAGFIGTHVLAALRTSGHEVIALDLMLPSAHGESALPPDGILAVDVRDAESLAVLLRGVDVVCHQAAVVGAGIDAADGPAFASHNDFGTAVLLAAMDKAECRRLVLASSMVVYGDGHYRCDEHGIVVPAPRSDDELRSGRFEARCPVDGGDVSWALVDEDALRAGLVTGHRRFRHRVALPQRLWRPDATRHALLRGGRHVPLIPRGRRTTPRL